MSSRILDDVQMLRYNLGDPSRASRGFSRPVWPFLRQSANFHEASTAPLRASRASFETSELKLKVTT